jgi:hypothetical protein
MDLANPAASQAPAPALPHTRLHLPPNHRENLGLSATWLRFFAGTSSGDLSLWVQAPLAACSGTGAAMALDDCDLLLQAIDGWLAAELDWRWGDAQAPGGPGLACASWAPAEDAGESSFDQCRLELPWQLLRSAGPPPPPLASRLRWHDTPVQLTISRLCLESAELSDVELGGLVVMPESMAPGWTGWLHLPEEPPGRGCAIDLAASGWPRLPLPAFDAQDSPRAECTDSIDSIDRIDSRLCSVRLVLAAPVPTPLLAGWADPDCRLTDFATGQAQLWLAESDDAPMLGLLASGRLVPWGSGCAMLIDERH